MERLAHHALRGQLWDKAVQYGRQAGARALDHSAAKEALAAFDQARAALHELPESQERTEQLIDLCFEQRNALLLVAEFERLAEILHEARTLSERLGDQQRLAWALGYLAHLQSLLGQHPEAIESAERACAIAKGIGNLGLSVIAHYYMGLALWYAGDPSRAAESGRTAVLIDAPLGERLGLAVLPAVLARRLLAVALADLGEFAKGVAAGEESLELAQAAAHPYSEVLARMGLGYAHLRQGDFAAAARTLEPGVALCRTTGIRLALPIVVASLGHVYVWSGRVAEAVPLLEEAVEASTAIRMLSARSLFMTFRAEAYLVLGRIADARQQAEQAVALARAHQERGWEAWGLKLLGDVHAAAPAKVERDVIEQAIRAYRKAFALATELGMRPLVAHCHLGLAKLHGRTGQREEVGKHLTTAMTLYRDMDMRFWLEQAEAESRRPA